MKVRAAVLESYSSKLSVENVELGEPRMGEVLVKMISASICHTDIGGIQGHYEMLKLPVILGHEGAGIVESVGAGVTKVKPGDHALISVVVHCNRCSNCYKGLFYGCERFDRIAFGGDLLDGSKRLSKDGREISHFFAQSSFANFAVVPENIVIPVPKDVPLHKISPLSCGVQTGCGAVMNSGTDLGSTVAIFGCGGVGLSAIMAARVIGASEIIAVDVLESRLSLASELGATFTINNQKADPIKEIRRITAGGCDLSVECIGRKDTILQSIRSTRDFGTTILVGVPARETTVDVDFFTLFHRSVRGCVAGYANSDTFIPYLIKLYQQGRLPFDRLSPTSYSLDDINVAIDDMIEQKIIKPLIRF